MERLTNKREADAQREEYERRLANGYPRNIPEERFLRLAAYEDTERTPEEVTALGNLFDYALEESKTLTGQLALLNLIRDLARADKDGRLVMLPCKVGDTVYWVHGAVITECKVHRIQKNRNGLYICLKSKKSHGAFRTDLCFGKSIFLTREEAEAALKAMKNGNS